VRGSIEVHRYLTERDIPHEFYRLERPLRRVDEAAALLDLDPAIVVTGELFEVVGGHVLALVASSLCASADAVARATGKPRAWPLSKVRVAAHTGFLADWLPPVGHERPSRALIDADLVDADVVYAPGGDPGVMLSLRSADLVRATAAEVVELAGRAEEDAELPPAATTGLR
jgi:prolyl-tRNA editing enzyme YbaK/EbsC (Cys-tRNA(Pro) deacylase)